MTIDCNQVTKFQLTQALFNNEMVTFIHCHRSSEICVGQVIGIAWESGGGQCFNITLGNGRGRQSIFVRTID